MKFLFYNTITILLFISSGVAEIPTKKDIFELGSVKNSFSNNILSKSLWGRPELPEYYISSEGHFKIHYTITGDNAVPTESTNPDGVPDWIYNTARYAERAYFVLVDSMGFDAPPPDGVDGDEYDIYFQEYNGSFYANTYPENPVESTSRTKDYTTYLILDNDFVESNYATNGYDALKVTISHEFFHMVQIGYSFDTSNYLSSMSAGDAFFFEWSSTWFEEFMYPEVNDYVAYARNFTNAVDSPIWTYNGFFEYAQGIFLKFIIDRYSTDIIVKTWDKILKGERAYFAIEDVIKEETSSTLAELYNEYCQRMYFTGHRYDELLSVSDDAQYFPPMQIHWSQEYEFNFDLEIRDFINYVRTLPIQIMFNNSQEFGLLENNNFSDDLLGRYIFIDNGNYSLGQFNLKSDKYIARSSLQDTLLLFITNTNENTSVEMDITLGYVEPINVFSFKKVFPNPTDGNGQMNLFITTKSLDDEIKIRIYNLLGQEIYSKNFTHQEDDLYSISFKNDIRYPISSGIYILQVESGNKFKTKKFTILK